MIVMTTMPSASTLARELQALVAEGVLTTEQADRLWQAVEQDRGELPQPDTSPVSAPRQSSAGVLDVLGYVGGALLLGAVIFVGSDPVGRPGSGTRRSPSPSPRSWYRWPEG